MEADIVPNKVHIFLSVDTLDSAAVKRIVAEHDALSSFSHIEWVNDSEANFIYNDEESAVRALYALTLPGASKPEDIPIMDERPAKPFSEAQGVDMRVRIATSTDVKKKGAADESRYYLLNPDKDPRERQRKRELAIKRRRDWDAEAGTYTRNRFDDRENKRRRGEERWEASMYDDNAGDEMEEDDDTRRKRVRFTGRRGGELFGRLDRDDGRLRGRSASPPRDGDGRYGFGTDEDDMSTIRRRIRQRSQTPPRLRHNANAGKELFATDRPSSNPNAGKELFGDILDNGRLTSTGRNAGRELFDTDRTASNSNVGRELFGAPPTSTFRDTTNPNAGKELFDRPFSRDSNPNAGKELFSAYSHQTRTSFSGDDLSIAGAALRRRGSNHRRTDAIDASPRMSNNAASLSPELKPRLSLVDRISGGPAGRRINGGGRSLPLSARITTEGGSGGFAGRVTKDGDIDMGIAVKGAAAKRNNPNAGKELFGNVRRRSMLSS